MANFNKVFLMGNLTRDPQLSYLPSQTPVAELGLAVNRRWTGKDGERKEDTCFVDCRAFGGAAETLNKYMSKGQPIFIEGRLKLDSWKNKDGAKRNKLKVVIESFQFLGGGSSSDAGQDGQSSPYESEENDSPPESGEIPF